MNFRARMLRRRALVVDGLRTRLWPVPTLAIIVAIASGMGLSQLDKSTVDALPDWLSSLLFGGGPDAAREVLGAISGSMITVTSLTFSLTLVTLQLASGQFSPRLLRTFVQDRFVQRTLALFLATFAYALTVLRTVRSGADAGGVDFVPKVAVTVAFLLAVASVIALVLFLAHLVREIRIETMLAGVHEDSLKVVQAITPEHDPQAAAPELPARPQNAHLVNAASSGFVVRVEQQALLDLAVEMNAVISVDRTPGSLITKGTPVASVWPDEGGLEFVEDRLGELRCRIAEAIGTGAERTPVQDLGYGLRQLTDVAVKALSPGINDPTTAIHALGHSAALLCEMASRDLTPVLLRDEDGRTRVAIRQPSLSALLDAAISQPRRYGASDPAVLAQLFMLLRDLAWRAPLPVGAAAITEQLARLQTTVAKQDFDPEEMREMQRLASDVVNAQNGVWSVDAPTPRNA